jgi:uncharacterized protein (TIGR03435 family)
MFRRSLIVALLGALVAVSAQAQEFKVASVKLSPPRDGAGRFISVNTDPAMVRYANISVKNLIAIAYGMDSRLVGGGPSWSG